MTRCGISPRNRHAYGRPTGRAAINQAFFEAYFSNFIEGTEFAVDEASAIVFDGVIPANRPADAHDVLGTFRLVSDADRDEAPAEERRSLSRCPAATPSHHHGRPAGKGPGCVQGPAQQGRCTIFVAPEDVHGTLLEGFRIYQRLTEPLHRAIFMMFLVSEVHPFADGNGRVARVMMNAELAAAQPGPCFDPDEFIARTMSRPCGRSARTLGPREPIIKTLVFAQRYVDAVAGQSKWPARCSREQMPSIRPEQGATKMKLPT